MFNNLINLYDLRSVSKRAMRISLKAISGLVAGRQAMVRASWAHTEEPPTNWWDIPAVQARWNRMISGDPHVAYHAYISQKYLQGRGSLKGLSLGCGTGSKELPWVETGKFSCIDAYDLSIPRIETAANISREKGYGDIIHYKVGDVYKINVEEASYDIVLGEQSLHHFSPLEDMFLTISRILKPDGYLIINEFVGPTRFQWEKRQLEAVNRLLSLLPAKYKTLWNSSSIKPKVIKHSRLGMIINDPSEAVESSRMRPLLDEIFDVIEVGQYGGSILHLLFGGIAHNFLSNDVETRRWLDLCFEVEDLLLAGGEVESDFIVAVCRKKLH